MLSIEENKKISTEINTELKNKCNKCTDDKKIDISSPVYIFCKLKSKINSKNENGWTPIYRAILANNLEALYELLKLGADPNISNSSGETPLYLSVDINNYDALIILLQYKADCNKAKKNGNTPLHLATKRNKTSFISALLRSNANPNIVNKLYSQTSTHLAIINKVDECILNEFNECKADIYNIKDKYEKTPFDYAKDVGDQNYINLLIKIFGNSSGNNVKNSKTWVGNNANEIENDNENTPVKINYADKNNSNFISLAKNIYISFDENDLNKNSGSVIIKNINDDNKNILFDSTSNRDNNNNYENNKENIDINTSIKNPKSILRENISNTTINFTEPIKIKNKSININTNKILNNEEDKNTETIKKINLTKKSIEFSSNLNAPEQPENINSTSNNNNKLNQNNNISEFNSNIFNDNIMSSIRSNNSIKNNKSYQSSHSQTKKDINEMNPLEMINQVITTSNNSNIFSELQINTNNNKNTQSDDDENNKTIQENNPNINNIILNDSLEYSKSNAHITTEQSNLKKKNENNNNNKEDIDMDNINGLNITINEYEDINKKKEDIKNNNNNHHRQLSYHNNKQTNVQNNKENILLNNNNYNTSKRNSNTSINNLSINNSKKNMARVTTNQNELLTTVPNSVFQGDNTTITKQKFYKNYSTQPEIQKEQLPKDLIVEDYKNNLDNFNTYNNNNTYKQNPYLKNSNNNNKNSYSGFQNSNNIIYSFSNNNTYSNNNKSNNTNKFPSLKLSEIENVNYNNNNSFLSKNINKSEELSLCSPQNIPNEKLTRLREWLISCDLLCYYNLLIKNEIYDIDLYIQNLKKNKINISYKDIEDIGIKKPGHIFRFLLKLQIDTGILEYQIYNLIRNKFSSNILTTIGLTASTNIIKCCGITLFKQNGNGDEFKGNNICCSDSITSINNNYNYNDIFGFLKYTDLIDYKENFIHNGFDQIDYIFIQLFSNFKFNNEILNDYMHIYSEKDKKRVIHKLYEEKKRIALELGLTYDINEEQKIINSCGDINNNPNENEGSCIVF